MWFLGGRVWPATWWNDDSPTGLNSDRAALLWGEMMAKGGKRYLKGSFYKRPDER
jgi:hypothetical protein